MKKILQYSFVAFLLIVFNFLSLFLVLPYAKVSKDYELNY